MSRAGCAGRGIRTAPTSRVRRCPRPCQTRAVLPVVPRSSRATEWRCGSSFKSDDALYPTVSKAGRYPVPRGPRVERLHSVHEDAAQRPEQPPSDARRRHGNATSRLWSPRAATDSRRTASRRSDPPAAFGHLSLVEVFKTIPPAFSKPFPSWFPPRVRSGVGGAYQRRLLERCRGRPTSRAEGSQAGGSRGRAGDEAVPGEATSTASTGPRRGWLRPLPYAAHRRERV